MSTLDRIMNGWSEEECSYFKRCNMCQFLYEYKLLCTRINIHKSCKKKQKTIILLTLGFTK